MKRSFLFIFIIIILILLSCNNGYEKGNIIGEYIYREKRNDYSKTRINKNIIKDIKLVLKNHKVPYGFSIIADCKTGEIIAIVEYSHRNYKTGEYINTQLICSSIFKLIPLAAVIGKGIYKPESKIKFYTSMYSELDNYIKLRKIKKPYYFSIKKAIAFSNNPVFAEIGFVLGKESIIEYTKKFLFIDTIINGIKTGYIDSIKTKKDIAKLSAGLNYSYITPFHALMIAMVLGNKGELIVPYFSSDKTIKKRIISELTAKYMLDAMSTTTIYGTSSKIFKMDKTIAKNTFAKTGSLYGKNPEGFYNWFLGVYKGNKTNYAIVCLTVNDPKWDIKANYLGFKSIQFIKKYEDN